MGGILFKKYVGGKGLLQAKVHYVKIKIVQNMLRFYDR